MLYNLQAELTNWPCTLTGMSKKSKIRIAGLDYAEATFFFFMV